MTVQCKLPELSAVGGGGGGKGKGGALSEPPTLFYTRVMQIIEGASLRLHYSTNLVLSGNKYHGSMDHTGN